VATSTHWRLRLLSRALIRRRTELLRYIFSFFEGSCLLSSNLLRDLFLLDPYLLALSVPSLRCFLFLRLFKRESVQGRALLGDVVSRPGPELPFRAEFKTRPHSYICPQIKEK